MCALVRWKRKKGKKGKAGGKIAERMAIHGLVARIHFDRQTKMPSTCLITATAHITAIAAIAAITDATGFVNFITEKEWQPSHNSWRHAKPNLVGIREARGSILDRTMAVKAA